MSKISDLMGQFYGEAINLATSKSVKPYTSFKIVYEYKDDKGEQVKGHRKIEAYDSKGAEEKFLKQMKDEHVVGVKIISSNNIGSSVPVEATKHTKSNTYKGKGINLNNYRTKPTQSLSLDSFKPN